MTLLLIAYTVDRVFFRKTRRQKCRKCCIGYSERRKFRLKMRQNAFGGRAPPGPAGGASALPQTPSRNLGGGMPTSKGGGEGIRKGNEGMERGKGKGREGRGRADPRPGLGKCKGDNPNFGNSHDPAGLESGTCPPPLPPVATLLWICCTSCSHSCAAVDKMLTDIARRAVRLR